MVIRWHKHYQVWEVRYWESGCVVAVFRSRAGALRFVAGQ